MQNSVLSFFHAIWIARWGSAGSNIGAHGHFKMRDCIVCLFVSECSQVRKKVYEPDKKVDIDFAAMKIQLREYVSILQNRKSHQMYSKTCM